MASPLQFKIYGGSDGKHFYAAFRYLEDVIQYYWYWHTHINDGNSNMRVKWQGAIVLSEALELKYPNLTPRQILRHLIEKRRRGQ